MKKTILIILIIVLYSPIKSQWIINDVTSDSITRKGINHIYNLEFENAEKEFQELIRRQPNQPVGYFFDAMIDWWRIMLDIENESLDDRFKNKIKTIIEICDNLLDKNEFDIVALFFKCGSIGFRGRLFSHRDSWLKAADDGRLAYPILKKASRLAPSNYDLQLGMGIYDYFADVIPNEYPILKPIMLFFPKGDKIRGIQELKIASEKAYYAKYESAYFLMQVYMNYENDYNRGLDLALNLYNQFPNNSVFHRYLGRAYVKLGKWVDIERTFSEILKRVRNKQRGYNSIHERESHYYLGMFYLNTDNYEESLKYFYKCDECSRELDKKKQSGFMVMTNLKIGMIYDLQMKRDLALMQYSKVLDMDNFDKAHDLASNYQKVAYRK